jgi:hypothetical protein
MGDSRLPMLPCTWAHRNHKSEKSSNLNIKYNVFIQVKKVKINLKDTIRFYDIKDFIKLFKCIFTVGTLDTLSSEQVHDFYVTTVPNSANASTLMSKKKNKQSQFSTFTQLN